MSSSDLNIPILIADHLDMISYVCKKDGYNTRINDVFFKKFKVDLMTVTDGGASKTNLARDRRIIFDRYDGKGMTFSKIGRLNNLSRSRVISIISRSKRILRHRYKHRLEAIHLFLVGTTNTHGKYNKPKEWSI